MASRKFKITASITVTLVLILAIAVGLTLTLHPSESEKVLERFSIDYENNCFVMNERPFQYVSGSFHYFRALPNVWRQRLKTMRSAGLNAVDTYIEWALHNPFDGQYNFEGIADLQEFLKIAQEENLYVILRPGPYICAERDNGGLPFWLLAKYPNIKIRTNDTDYINEIEKWYMVLMPKIQPFLYGNGGPVISIQIENEYGVTKLCDRNYLNWLRDETKKYVDDKVILFTVDIPNSVEEMKCGKIDGVLATTDFGIDRYNEIDKIWYMLRQVQPNGPLVNTEFYPGWLTHWQGKNERRDAVLVENTLRKMLKDGANVNFYMFFGGTNFGFTAGANNWGFGKYMADITSYDYDAIMTEAGDPYGIKFVKVRNVIGEFFDLPPIPVPDPMQKIQLNDIVLNEHGLLLSETGRTFLGRPQNIDSTSSITPKIAENPLTFEALNQFSGLVLYETILPDAGIDPTLLTVNGLKDRALVYVDGLFIGGLSRENGISSMPINAGIGQTLQILVENQGRINFEVFNDTKGIIGPVTIQKYDGVLEVLKMWTMTGYPLTNYAHIQEFITKNKELNHGIGKNGVLLEGPVIFSGNFNIEHEILDTYFDSTSWGKGVLYINGFNLGRYWPLVGPQITLYVPGSLLKSIDNTIVLIEYQRAPLNKKVTFTNRPKLDGM